MAELVPPTSRVRESFLAAMAEFTGEGRGGAGDHTMPFRSANGGVPDRRSGQTLYYWVPTGSGA